MEIHTAYCVTAHQYITGGGHDLGGGPQLGSLVGRTDIIRTVPYLIVDYGIYAAGLVNNPTRESLNKI